MFSHATGAANRPVSAGRQTLVGGAITPHPSRMRFGTALRAALGCVVAAAVGLLSAGPAMAGPAMTGPAMAGPVFVAPGVVDGYVWVEQPSTAAYTIAHGWAYNSAGGPVEVTRSLAGVYQVRFVGMAGGGGVAHARPYGSGNTAICVVSNWRASAGDQLVTVRCFDSAGVAADSRFVASYTNRGAAAGALAYLWASQPSPPIDVPYAPHPTYSYDSTGGAPQVWRQSVGVYMMVIPTVDSHYPVDHHDGFYQVTAYGTAAVRCEVHGENDEMPTPIAVFCVDEDGAPVDSRFSVTYAHGTSLLGTGVAAANAHFGYSSGNANSWNSVGRWNAGGAPGFLRLEVGRYRVSFPGLALTGGHATAGSRGNPFTYCHVSSWTAGSVTVHCFDNTTNLPADSEFGVAMTD
jgi:hypothetical protein